MTVKYGSTPLSDLFDPYVEGSKTCPSGEIYEGGTDIRNKYAPLSVGSKRGNIGVQIGGTDITNYFAAKGTAVYWDGTLADLPSDYSDYGNGPSQALVEVVFYSDGYIKILHNYSYGVTTVGTWTGDKADSSNTEVRFVVTSGSLTGNDATTFKRLLSAQTFELTSFNEGYKSATVRVELRQVGNASTVITKEIEISVSHNSGGGPGGPGET